jgi:hypothetical protein
VANAGSAIIFRADNSRALIACVVVADATSLAASMFIPAICYLLIGIYGWSACNLA